MRKEVQGLSSVKTLRTIKHRSIPRAEGIDDAELYLLKNNLIMAKKEEAGIERRKEILGKRISGIEERISELEGRTKKKRVKKRKTSPATKSSLRIIKVDY